MLQKGRGDLISLGFLLSIWSGSRALNVFVDTISIMYGQSGVRGIVRTRALSLTLYFLSLARRDRGRPARRDRPDLARDLLPPRVDFLALLYWPVVTVAAVASIATLFHISTPRRSPWLRDVPGAVLTLVIWVLASFVLRGTITASVSGGTSIYGPLSAPIVLLIFLYALAIAVLIGAALNAAIRGHVAGRGPVVPAGEGRRVGQGPGREAQGRRAAHRCAHGQRWPGPGGDGGRPVVLGQGAARRGAKAADPHAPWVRKRHGRHPIWRRHR